MADPSTLPLLKDWNDQKLADAMKLIDDAKVTAQLSGVQCPQSVSELLDVPGTQSSASFGELILKTVAVVCPDCGFTGERLL